MFNDLKWNKKIQKEFLEILNTKKRENKIFKNLNNISSENSFWNNISESQNCSWFDISWSKNCTDCYSIYASNDCKDLSYWWNNTSLIYESTSIWNDVSKIIFSWMCYGSVSNLIYCMNCVNWSSNLFGCVWLKNKQYCILNKQYTKEEYETIVPKIIEHMKMTWEWWEFFSASISPFGYNETVAQEYFPLSKDQIIQKWFNYSDYQNPAPIVSKTIPANKLPDDIKDIPDDILNWAILCEITNKPFRIIKPELEFYRKNDLSIPRRHPDQRHMDRMKLRNPRKLFDRKCDKCEIDIKTTFSPEREEIVYCEHCYNNEVI